MLRTTLLAAFTVLVLSSHVCAAGPDLYALEGRVTREPTNVPLLIQLGKTYSTAYNDSRQQGSSGKAMVYLEKALALEPSNLVAQGWYGVIHCMVARDKNSKDMANKGLKMLDKAVATDGANLTLRALRGNVGVECPADFNRLDQALADLTMVDEALAKDASVGAKFDINVPRVYLRLGKAYRAKGDLTKAAKYWAQSVKAGPDTRDGIAATGLLRKYGKKG